MPGGRVSAWIRSNLFGSVPDTLFTALVVALLVVTVPPAFEWAVVDGVFAGADPEACRRAGGACWAFVAEKHRLILFGAYPFAEQWRPLLSCLLFVLLLGASTRRGLWRPRLALYWAGGLAAIGVLMWGGVFGLAYVENTKWGGLPLTLILSVFGIALAFPLAVALALGRRSNLPAIRALSVGYIELVRGVPLISILFMASVMFPLFLPEGVTVDKLLRAEAGIVLFTAAYLAEVVRGGLQAIPKGQIEAADALGLTTWQRTRLVVLPQALRAVIPPLVGTFIGAFKDTSLVLIIGLFDLLSTVRAAIGDPDWRAFYVEGYLVAASIYFAFCFFMSRTSRRMEKELGPARALPRGVMT